MSVGQWLSTRPSKPPAELAAAIARAVGPSDVSGCDVPTCFSSAARELLPRVLGARCAERSSALDLLTLDALITFALEAGSDSAADCEATAGRLLAIIGEAPTH